MAENNKIYITANELAEMLDVSVGHAYKLIRKLNQELEKEGFLVIAGKVPRRYFENAGMVSVHRRWSNESGKRQENRKMVDSVSLYGLARKTSEIYQKRFCDKKRGGGMASKFPYYAKSGF